MREVVVKLWCDQHHAKDGSKIEATERVTPGVDSQAADLDLCKSCAAEVRGTIRAWLKIGRPVETKTRRGQHGSIGPRAQERTEKLTRLRDWSTTTGRRNSAGGDAWKTPGGHGNYDRIEPKFDAWEEAHGQWDPARWAADHPAGRNGAAPVLV